MTYLWLACLAIWAGISAYLLILNTREKHLKDELQFLVKLLKEYEHDRQTSMLQKETGEEAYKEAKIKPS
ncbi:MAG: CcmD family protein [Clostridia bacterium]|nr:CcmD family protein [Clostridia bacterium]